MCVASLRLVRNAVVAFAALVAVSITSSAARGECGDYVIVGRPLLNPSDVSPELGLKLAFMAVYSHDPASKHRAPTPCHGPQCSRRDPLPTPFGPGGTVTVIVPDLACLAGRVSLPRFAPEQFLNPLDSPIPQRNPVPIEHPPRIL